jgi:hypothetical protein
MDKTKKVSRPVCDLEIEKQRRIKAEREARVLRLALIRWHQQNELPATRKIWHP